MPFRIGCLYSAQKLFTPDAMLGILGLLSSHCLASSVTYLCGKNESIQAGTELGQAQLKLGLNFTIIFCGSQEAKKKIVPWP